MLDVVKKMGTYAMGSYYSFKENHLSFSIFNFKFVIEEKALDPIFFQ
jgi:hypothetical protein